MAKRNHPKHRKSLPLILLKTIGRLLLFIIILVAGMLLFLTITEYKPDPAESLTVSEGGEKALQTGDSITAVSWNIGYGALGDNADFFMDGGTGVRTADAERLDTNLSAILSFLQESGADVYLLQETDRNSARSGNIDETQRIAQGLPGYSSTFGNNFKVPFIPYPLPPIGKVDSGILTLSRYPIESADRLSLPCPFSWPLRIANLKRCLVVNRIPLSDSGHELVLVNLHLEAYDSGEGKEAQTKQMMDLLQKEADAGNYVIAAGDFNQTFSNIDTSMYPEYEGMWMCGRIDTGEYENTWQFAMDNSVPSCRSLDKPYADADKSTFQYYLIDGFILSQNISVESLETVDLGFVHSDHNPVVLNAVLE